MFLVLQHPASFLFRCSYHSALNLHTPDQRFSLSSTGFGAISILHRFNLFYLHCTVYGINR